jgi:hypothetical protein
MMMGRRTGARVAPERIFSSRFSMSRRQKGRSSAIRDDQAVDARTITMTEMIRGDGSIYTHMHLSQIGIEAVIRKKVITLKPRRSRTHDGVRLVLV